MTKRKKKKQEKKKKEARLAIESYAQRRQIHDQDENTLLSFYFKY